MKIRWTWVLSIALLFGCDSRDGGELDGAMPVSDGGASDGAAVDAGGSRDGSTPFDGGGMCGNGVTEAPETCDGDCPASCDDADACTEDVRSGTPDDCDVVCSHPSVSACVSGDGCCPAGCTVADDDDCAGPDQCTIAGAVYDADDLAPAGGCLICDPATSATDWTACPAPAWRRAWPTARGGHAMVALARGVLLYGGDPSVSGRGADEVFRFDGRRWHDETHLAQPTLGSRVGMSMVYDSARDRVVVFGGYTPPSGAPVDADTYERAADGTWSVPTTSGPEARTFASMSYDPVRNIVLLFGGRNRMGTNLRDTWQLDGGVWTEVTPSGGPLPRYGHAMAYDPGRSAIVLHGGTDATTTYTDTWEWDGSAWVRGSAGPMRAFHAMAHDAREGALLVWGGDAGGGTSPVATLHARDTAGAWSMLSPTGAPGARTQAAMAHDPGTATTYLFGGYERDATIRDPNQLFAYDASGFRQLGAAPTPRSHHAMAFDSVRGRTVLHGGSQRYSGASTALSDTWEWDGARWERVSTAGPGVRANHAMAFDPVRERTVLFGGVSDTATENDTWEWDGSTWTAITTSAAPDTRFGHAMAYDPDYGGILLVGGRRGGTRLGDAWLFDGSAWANLGSTGIRAHEEHAMTYDEGGARVLLCGGQTDSSGLGLYSWADSTWTRETVPDGFCRVEDDLIAHDALRDLNVVMQVVDGQSIYLSGGSWTTVDSPAARRDAAMSGGPRGAVMFGGSPGLSSSYGYEETWVFGY